MQERPFFSVVTVCKNDLGGLILTAQSLLDQNCRDFEWIVVDGASADGTVDYLAKRPIARMRHISEPDTGLYDAMNKGMEIAEGEFFLFLNAADTLDGSTTLENVRYFIATNHGFDIYYGDAKKVDRFGEQFYQAARHHSKVWYNLFTVHQSIFFRRNCFDKRRYDLRYRVGADYALVATLILIDRVPASRMPICISRFAPGGISDQSYFLGEKDDWLFRKQELGFPLWRRAIIWLIHAIVRLGRKRLTILYNVLRYKRPF